MSLINNSFEDFYYIAVSMMPDGEGGQISEKNNGGKFKAVVRTENFSETKIAEKSTKNVTYTITTRRNIELKFNELIKRKSDGKIFRITSDSRCAPSTSGLDMRQVTAEEKYE